MRFGTTLSLAVFLLVGPGTVARAQEAIGDFYLFDRTDPMSGADRTSITTLAVENFVSGAGGLTFRCAEEGFEMTVTASYLGRKTGTPVRYSFADEEPREATWSLRSTGMAAIAPPDAREDFVRRALSESSVIVTVSDYQMRTHTYTFHLNGLEQALERLTCR